MIPLIDCCRIRGNSTITTINSVYGKQNDTILLIDCCIIRGNSTTTINSMYGKQNDTINRLLAEFGVTVLLLSTVCTGNRMILLIGCCRIRGSSSTINSTGNRMISYYL